MVFDNAEGFRGAFKTIALLGRPLGIFPFTTTPQLQVSKYWNIYGIFFVLPFLNGIYISLLYDYYYMYQDPASETMFFSLHAVYLGSVLLQMDYVVVTASQRISIWLSCIKTTEKFLIRNKKTEKKERLRKKLIIPFLISNVLIILLSATLYCIAEECGFWFVLSRWVFVIPYVIGVSCDSFLFILLTIRIHSATVAMNQELKKLFSNMDPNDENRVKKLKILRNNYLVEPTTKTVTTNEGVLHKIRELSEAYTTISDMIKIATESAEVAILIDTVGMLVRLMCRSYKLAKAYEFLDGYVLVMTNLTEIYWCITLLGRFFFLCEVPHRTHNMMLETQDLIVKMKRKYHNHIAIVNELNLFYCVTMLSQTTYSPLNVCTLDRGLVAKIVGYSLTYLITIMQLVNGNRD